MPTYKIAAMGGDGIGPEVVGAVLERAVLARARDRNPSLANRRL